MQRIRRRRFLVAACGSAALALTAIALPASAQSASVQPQGKVWSIGYLGYTSAGSEAIGLDRLRAGLRELGYVDGVNTLFEYRFADGNFDRLPGLAAELVRLRVDVIVTFASPAVRAAMQATTTVPIVMTASADAVATGLVASLARPGGNVTGFTILSPELAVKRLELLKEAVPRIARVAVLVRQGNPANELVVPAMTRAAKPLDVTLQQFVASGPPDFQNAFAAIAMAHLDAVVITDDPVLNLNWKSLAELATQYRLPSAYTPAFADAGGLIGYGGTPGAGQLRAAHFVDRILKGAKPADLPIEQPTTFELVVNRKTEKALALGVSRSTLARADRVID